MPVRTRRMPGQEATATPRRNRRARTAPPALITPNYQCGSLKDLRKNDMVLQRMRSGPVPNLLRNKDKYLHVSDLLNRCMRMFALAERTGTALRGDPLYDNLGVTFAIGNAIGQYMVNKSAATMENNLWGDWRCMCGHTVHVGVCSEAKKHTCDKCERPLINYHEHVFVNDEYNISGSVDLSYLIDQHLYLAEVKSIKKEDWEALVRPIPIHKLQVLFYWWLARERGYSLYKQVSILYVCKAHTRGSPIKEFVFDPTDELDRLYNYLEDARMLKAAKEGGPLPFRICASETVTSAKNCQVCTVCFGV